MCLMLEKTIIELALRIQTYSNYELIKVICTRSIKVKKSIKKKRKLKSSLQLLDKPLKKLIKKEVKKRISFVTFLWWNASSIRIVLTTKIAIARYNQVLTTKALRIYINESEINDKINAIIYFSQLKASIKKYLSNSTHYTIYFEELEKIDIIY